MNYDQYIDIDKNIIPYQLEIELGGEPYQLEINYNRAYDFFTVDLFKDHEPLVVGEKLRLNRPLFHNVVNIELPKVRLIPADRANKAVRITHENFNDTVFLYVLEGVSNE